MKITKTFVLKNNHGLHARPASLFVKKVEPFNSQVKVMNSDNEIADGKSIIGLMCLAAKKGDKVKITAHGNDAKEVIYVLESLFEMFFNSLTPCSSFNVLTLSDKYGFWIFK